MSNVKITIEVEASPGTWNPKVMWIGTSEGTEYWTGEGDEPPQGGVADSLSELAAWYEDE